MDMKQRFYISGKQYIPEDSDLLCAVDGSTYTFVCSTKLYRTRLGAYFFVREGSETGIKVEVVDEKEAFAFMDSNAACIDVDVYDRVFGAPEPG